MKFKIDKHIPPPPPSPSRLPKLPFADLKVGESFTVGESLHEINQMRRAAYKFHEKNTEIKLVTRKNRCWRVA